MQACRKDTEDQQVVGEHGEPDEELEACSGASQASSDTSFQSMTRFQQQLAEIVESDDAVAGVGSILGSMTVNRGLFFISLKPIQERTGFTTQRVIDRLRTKLETMPGVRLYMFPNSGYSCRWTSKQLRLPIHGFKC